MRTAPAPTGRSCLIQQRIAKLRTGHQWTDPGLGRRQVERGSLINVQCHGPPGRPGRAELDEVQAEGHLRMTQADQGATAVIRRITSA